MIKNITDILSNLLHCLEFSKTMQFKTIDLVNVAFHEAQIDLRNYLENANEVEKKNAYELARFTINKMVEDGLLYKYFDNKEKTGFVVQPFMDTDMSHPNQYTFVILDDCEDIIA